MEVCVLGSGSSGNSYVMAGASGVILVDAGFSARETITRAEFAGVSLSTVGAILITHGHSDHSRGAAVLARRFHIPIWATAATLTRIPGLNGAEELRTLSIHKANDVAGFSVRAMTSPHDAPGAVILKVDMRVGVATDLGYVSASVRRFLTGLEGLLLEFNHDITMLRNGPYPPWLQERIQSRQGHLSNVQAATLLCAPDFVPPRRVLWLCHLSEKNNDPKLALRTAMAALGDNKPIVVVARQDVPGYRVVIG
ncbi:MAG: hypothetical protein A2289_23680 [Deltaproteobacteria bacterium RIFOXYA12_FULL_58_15]|nr:MAG: hypothetical protein A2289_23680 [Deltaproteobacteria bacterium RIFOXYA12_FULL_58_15]OGR08818.1 MAG: hypothetical protein A2341_10185 [Deltaproteobacteria bacterium RIFOXYB12_FULL_58_9]